MSVQNRVIVIYFFIFATLLTVMSLAPHTNDKIRGASVAFIAPLWEKILSFKHFLFFPSRPSPFSSSLSIEEEKERLQLENQLLQLELLDVYKQLDEQLLLSSKIAHMVSLSPNETRSTVSDYEKSLKKALSLTKQRLKAMPARVIFRSLDTWNNSLWINIGRLTDLLDQEFTIAVNSPVVIGNAVIGIVDYVGDYQSRVRLITDNRLKLSVRAARGGEQEALLSAQIENLLQQMNRKKYSFFSSENQAHLIKFLKELKEGLQPLKKTWYLAKGELSGSPSLYRSDETVHLKGIGFNYDFSDDEGESRDLRSGKSLLHPHKSSIPILKVDDVLVTTGMDGIFPSGFQAAIVTHVGLLKEGDYFYHLEAEPIAKFVEELTLVFVLPALTSSTVDFKK